MSIKSSKSRKKSKVSNDKTFDTRRAAFRAAKRDMDISSRTQPFKVMSSSQPGWEANKMDGRNKRLYIFRLINFFLGKRRISEIHIREDKGVIYPDNKGNQPDHFNVGEPPKLKKHYFFKERKKTKK